MSKVSCSQELKSQKIRHAGLIAGLRGRSSDKCPWQNESKRAAWIEGWRDGREGFLEGTFWLH